MNKEKFVCYYHSRDLDGWTSGAIVKKSHELRGKEEGTLELVGWDYGDKIPDWAEFDGIIMCDISFPVETMVRIAESDSDFVWCDHHHSAIVETEAAIKASPKAEMPAGLRRSDYAACELTWRHFFKEESTPELVHLLGRYDCFGHKGTHEERKVLNFQYGARATMASVDDVYFKLNSTKPGQDVAEILEKGRVIYKHLCMEAEQTLKKAFPIEVLEPLTTEEREHKVYKFLCVNQERFNPINFGIDYHKDGYDGVACFWLKDGKWNFSLYNDNGEVDCSAIAKGFGGGGHKGAAGFLVDTDQLRNIIKL